MRLGAQSIVGYEAPTNLTHLLMDNAIHESTGGQATVARSVSFPAIAAASGYREVHSLANPQAVGELLAAENKSGGARFMHVPTLPGIPEDLPRPSIKPAEVARRLQEFLSHG